VDLGGENDGDVDVDVDDEDGTSPHAKGVPASMTVLNSPWRQPQSSMIVYHHVKKRTLASTIASKNLVQIRASLFPWYGGLVKRRRGGDALGESGPYHVAKKCGHVVGPLLAHMRPLVSLLPLDCSFR
jgi:hypothetical protein